MKSNDRIEKFIIGWIIGMIGFLIWVIVKVMSHFGVI